MLACPNFFSLWLQYFGLFDIESSVLEFLVEVWRTRSSLLLVFLFVVEGLHGRRVSAVVFRLRCAERFP